MENIEQLAKEFFKENVLYCGKEGATVEYLTNFLQSMIDSGKMVEAEKYERIHDTASKLYESGIEVGRLFPKSNQQVGEVKSAEEYIIDIYGDRNMLRTVATLNVPSIHTLMEDYADYCNQFKTTATPVKDISGYDVEKMYSKWREETKRIGSVLIGKSPIELLKWYQSQLNK